MQRQTPRLRTKTGCIPCRLAKKKCDETWPTCRRCHVGGRVCRRPNTIDLADRRHLPSHRPLPPQQSGRAALITTATDRVNESLTCHRDRSLNQSAVRTSRKVGDGAQIPELTLQDAVLVHTTSARAIETVLSRHFTFGFYKLILLPGCSQHFFKGWLSQLCQLAKRCPSLYNSLLACAASHLYMMDGVETMQHLALTYYSNAIRQLLKALANDEGSWDTDGLLSAIIFLLIHGCQGVRTFADIPGHLGAASRIMLEVLHPIDTPRRYLDTLIVESVLFHAFHACTGLWSDTDDELHYGFDHHLWRKAEMYLRDSSDHSEVLTSLEGPVLGVPASLLRLAIQLRQLYRSPLSFTVEEIQNLQTEVVDWEKKVLFDMKVPVSESEDSSRPLDADRGESSADVTALYVLAVSLLLENIPHGVFPLQTASLTRPWQVRVAVEITQKHESDQRWHRNYMGNWPVYTLAAFALNDGPRELLRRDLQKRWTLTRMRQSKRFLDDLEMMWSKAAPT